MALDFQLTKNISLQGAGINIDRGAEEAIEAIAKTENAALLFIGGGDVLSQLKEKVKAMKIAEKFSFFQNSQWKFCINILRLQISA